MALITIDNDRDHTRPSTFGPGGLASLDAALDQVAAMPDLAAIAVTGKPFIFAVGADLSAIGLVKDQEVIRQFGELGHAVFRRLGEMDVPTFAFVNGAAMGGGTELALHCDYRTMSTGAAAMSLPEVFLGLIPGWGGAWLLPNLIGPANALEVIIANPMQQNRQMKPKDALRLGVVDALFEPADFLEQSIAWAAGVVNGDVARRSRSRRPRQLGRRRRHRPGHARRPDPRCRSGPVPSARPRATRRGRRSRDEGFAAEDVALSELVMGDELRSSLYAFDLVQKRAKRPVGVPDKSLARKVTKVGVVGAGLMASQLALLFAKRLQVPVVMTDLDAERVEKGLQYVRDDVAGQVAKGRLTQDKANRLTALVTGSTDKGAFADADFVIEAVFENLAVKKQVFAEVEAVVSETCILATNTSSLSVTDMAADLAHPERVVGFHFFNPVALMPLLEIARAEQTDDETLATAFAVGKSLKKTCVLVKDAPAFVVNRLLTRYMGEIIKAVDEGTPLDVADRASDPLGLPMSPFNLMALVGPAVAFHVPRPCMPPIPTASTSRRTCDAIVEAGRTTFRIKDADGAQVIDPEVAAFLEQGDVVLTEEQVRTRAAGRRWPTRLAACSTRASSPRRRTSTCA